MPEQVGVHEAKTHLSKLLERVEAWEEIVIARNGHPVAQLVAPRPLSDRRRGRGAWRGRVTYDQGTFGPELDAEIAREFGVDD